MVALLGARQCGKASLAGLITREHPATTFDLESPQDLARLRNPELALSATSGLVIIDEIQRKPELCEVLRVLVDREAITGRFLILGSASPLLIQGSPSLWRDAWSSSISLDSTSRKSAHNR